MAEFLPEFTVSATFTGEGSGALVFSAIPIEGLASVLSPFFKGDTGPPGPPGPTGYPLKRAQHQATVDGEQAITLPSAPSPDMIVHIFINGLLHNDTADYAHVGVALLLSAGAGVMSGDKLTIIYQ